LNDCVIRSCAAYEREPLTDLDAFRLDTDAAAILALVSLIASRVPPCGLSANARQGSRGR